MAILSARNISVTFGRQAILRDISLDVLRGQTLVVIGESGCGKTVLLKLLIGLLAPTGGIVQFDGRDLATLAERQLIQQRLRFGFLFQNAALFDSMDVMDNIAFGVRQHRRLPPDEVEALVHQRLTEVGLPENVLHKNPAELSGGMRKRVGLARALALDPEIMLYDEPTTGLDPIMSDVINELILQTRRNRPVTSIVVTHDMKTVRKVADRVVMLYPLARLAANDGQILFDGPPDDLWNCSDERVSRFVTGEAGNDMMSPAPMREPTAK